MRISLPAVCLSSLVALASVASAAPEPVPTKSGEVVGLVSADGAVHDTARVDRREHRGHVLRERDHLTE